MSSISPKRWLDAFVQTFFVVMSDQNFVLCDPDGVLVGHDVLSREKRYLQPCSDAICFGEMMTYLIIILSNEPIDLSKHTGNFPQQYKCHFSLLQPRGPF